jgi:hypothetical protein
MVIIIKHILLLRVLKGRPSMYRGKLERSILKCLSHYKVLFCGPMRQFFTSYKECSYLQSSGLLDPCHRVVNHVSCWNYLCVRFQKYNLTLLEHHSLSIIRIGAKAGMAISWIFYVWVYFYLLSFAPFVSHFHMFHSPIYFFTETFQHSADGWIYPIERRTFWQYFACLHQDIILCGHIFSSPILNTALFLTTDCDYKHLYVHILHFLTLWPSSQLYSNWSVFVYCMLVIQSVQKTLSLWKSSLALSNRKKKLDL